MRLVICICTYVCVCVHVCILVRYPVLLMVQCKRCGLEKQHLFSLSGFETVSPHIQRIPAVCVCEYVY